MLNKGDYMENNLSKEKSHSKWSNFKLSCLCILITLSMSSLWIIVCFKNYFKFALIVLLGFFSIVTLFLSIILLFKFKR